MQDYQFIKTHSMAHAVRRVGGKLLQAQRLLIPQFIFSGILCRDRLYAKLSNFAKLQPTGGSSAKLNSALFRVEMQFPLSGGN
jgi:hypothetical protein